VLGLRHFVEMLDHEVPIPRPVLPDDKLDPVGRAPAGPMPASTADQLGPPPPPRNGTQPAEIPLADPQQLCRFDTLNPPPRYRFNVSTYPPSVPRVASRSPDSEPLQESDRPSAAQGNFISTASFLLRIGMQFPRNGSV
jgi:hypothetical protein